MQKQLDEGPARGVLNALIGSLRKRTSAYTTVFASRFLSRNWVQMGDLGVEV